MVYRAKGPGRARVQAIVTLTLFCLIVMFLAFTGSGDEQPQAKTSRKKLVRFDAGTRLPKTENTRKKKVKPQLKKTSVLSGLDLRKGKFHRGRFVQQLPDNTVIETTVEPRLQKYVHYLFKTAEVPFGAFVALDVKTGKVLAMVSYSHEQPNRRGLTRTAIAPAASVFKVITTAALLETAKLSPTTNTCYHGGRHGIRASNLVDNKRLDRRCSTLDLALGRSTNSIFGKLAHKYLSPTILRRYALAFGFNSQLPFILPAESGRALISNNRLTMANTAAGFWNTTLSPLHGAMIAQALANGGLMMHPLLVSRAFRGDSVIFQQEPRTMRRVVNPYIAKMLARMMVTTTEKGSGRRYFRRRRQSLKGIKVAGKTGSLSSKRSPYLHYSWFMGFAPAEKPTIAIAAFVGNRRLWKIKSAYVAKEALSLYFRIHPPK